MSRSSSFLLNVDRFPFKCDIATTMAEMPQCHAEDLTKPKTNQLHAPLQQNNFTAFCIGLIVRLQ